MLHEPCQTGKMAELRGFSTLASGFIENAGRKLGIFPNHRQPGFLRINSRMQVLD
jgi:hypothetical protein